MRRSLAVLVAMTMLTTLTACGSNSAPSGSPDNVTLTVFAAASLKDTFTQIGRDFEAENKGVKVRFNFAGSSDLVAQIQQGAPADVFASADSRNMARATGDDLVSGSPSAFATNTLEIATPPGNPAKIHSLQDLSRKNIKVVLCAAEVPCGSASRTVETSSGVDIRPVSEEQSVTDVLGKVESGEADAGLVYVTDVRSAGGRVTGVSFPESAKAVNTYPIAALTGGTNVRLATAFISFVTGPKGQAILAAAGFAKPRP